jgi:Holliday junction resolvasome RuvABC DNA-binding subunit
MKITQQDLEKIVKENVENYLTTDNLKILEKIPQFDYKSAVNVIFEKSKEIKDLLENNEQMPVWLLETVKHLEDRIKVVHDYVNYIYNKDITGISNENNKDGSKRD